MSKSNQTLVNYLDSSCFEYKDEVSLKTAIMSFVNAIINYGPGEDHLEFRLHLRYEFLMLGIQPVIDKMKEHENAVLDRHIDIFEMVRNEDDKELARRYDKVHVDTRSASSMFDVLKRKLTHTAGYPHFLSLLQHCLLNPFQGSSYSQFWLLLDRITQQIVLQNPKGIDPDYSPLDINVKEIIEMLVSEDELKAAKEKAASLELENNEINCILSKKDQQIDQYLQEKEDLQASLDKLKIKLEKETLNNLEANQKLAEQECRINELTQMLKSASTDSKEVGNILQDSSISDDVKAGIHLPPPTPPPCVQTPLSEKGRPPLPPPPPPPGLGCPPAPPSMPSRCNTLKLPKKDIPQPSTPLKSFNWSKLSDAKLEGTLWAEFDVSKLYKDIDLADFDRSFSAYQKQTLGSVEDIPCILSRPTRFTRELSVIDCRRAQNCTILLSKLRLSNDELCKAILSMDSKDQLAKDMLEQILKFMPSSEEKALLEEHSNEIENMARADRFLYELTKIPRYEQRIRTLFYKKKFKERIDDCKPKINAVLEACKEVQRSKKLKKLLELVLAFGNYMNRGQRGNASGFHVASLNRIADTKSSINRNVTLLHYILKTVENKFKDVFHLEEDIPHVREAAKVNLTELSKEILSLKVGLQEVQKEMEYHRSQPQSSGDQYVPVMKEFVTIAIYQMSELEESFQDMNTRYERVLRIFGEDASHMQAEDFFTIFDTFLTSFTEAKQENESMKRKKEDEEKRIKQEEEVNIFYSVV
ncbi:disheveled-associated activator of morphogenesis 1-like [Centruroides sculpturatus]|uniref:disheveled-associated activator of morphogenesis 1-like n=1 Tax=Centruroides sculpturatus TaxID=218467 RepID=UPI000C6E93FF|nr:disheveled-associated activator of morphogenesis 1-like [Centruroides sculpturatus]